MREAEHPYLAATAAIELWLDNKDPAPALDGVPDHLVDMVKYSAKIYCQNIVHWAKQRRKGLVVPKNIAAKVDRYLRARQ